MLVIVIIVAFDAAVAGSEVSRGRSERRLLGMLRVAFPAQIHARQQDVSGVAAVKHARLRQVAPSRVLVPIGETMTFGTVQQLMALMAEDRVRKPTRRDVCLRDLPGSGFALCGLRWLVEVALDAA